MKRGELLLKQKVEDKKIQTFPKSYFAHLAEAVEYTDIPNECPGYGEVQVMMGLWGMRSTLHCHFSKVNSGPVW